MLANSTSVQFVQFSRLRRLEMSDYKKYTHVERLSSEACDGLLDNDTVYVTAKVDGSNGCVFWDSSSDCFAVGSRNNLLSDKEDNGYFYAWAMSNGTEQQLLKKYCEENQNKIVYGEWMGRDSFIGAFKHYAKTSKATFFIFDVYDCDTKQYLPEMQWRQELAGYGLDAYFIKLLATLNHPTFEDVLSVAKSNDFLLEGTGLIGEGVVCKVPGFVSKFGNAVYGKIVLDEFKKQKKPLLESEPVEPQIVETYMTDSEINKSVAKVLSILGAEAFDASSHKMMGMLQSLCWKDLLEECPNWVKKFKNPKVDFAVLAGRAKKRVQDHVL